jgi:6-phosphogluconolactonase
MTSIDPAFSRRGLHSRGFLTGAALVAAALPCALIASACAADGQAGSALSGPADLVWFGTYTGGKPDSAETSAGIYVASFDPTTGRLSPPRLAAAAKNPSFLAFHPTLPVAYAVSEVTTDEGRPGGGIAAFTIDEASGGLTEINRQSSGGAGPCHVSVDPTGRTVLAANYGGGSVICLGIGADGRLAPAVPGTPGGFIQHVFSGADETGGAAKRQAKPHAHSIYPTPDARFAIACDLGLDKVFVHALDVERAVLTPHATAHVAAGAGPRHFALHPAGRHGYSVNELDLTVTAFAFEPEAGRLTPIQTLSTLPPDVADRTGFSTAEIVVHPSGRFVYASNRGHDSIAMYTVDEASGRLSFLGTEPIRGKTPRNFVLDPTGRFLLAAGQQSDTVTVFAVDEATGRLAFTGQSEAVPAPVCIRFRPRAN